MNQLIKVATVALLAGCIGVKPTTTWHRDETPAVIGIGSCSDGASSPRVIEAASTCELPTHESHESIDALVSRGLVSAD